MPSLLNLHDLLAHEIDDLYSAEAQIIKALPKMVEKASDRELKKALNEHLKVTQEQKSRLDKVKGLLKTPDTDMEKKGLLQRLFGSHTICKGTEGLIEEGEKMMGEDMDPRVKDAAIIAAAQKIEHYEISGYGTARTYARELGLTQVQKLLEATLREEYEADQALTTLAVNKINLEAENPRPQPAKAAAPKAAPAKKSSPAKKPAAKKPVAKKAAPKKAAPKKAVKKN